MSWHGCYVFPCTYLEGLTWTDRSNSDGGCRQLPRSERVYNFLQDVPSANLPQHHFPTYIGMPSVTGMFYGLGGLGVRPSSVSSPCLTSQRTGWPHSFSRQQMRDMAGRGTLPDVELITLGA